MQDYLDFLAVCLGGFVGVLDFPVFVVVEIAFFEFSECFAVVPLVGEEELFLCDSDGEF